MMPTIPKSKGFKIGLSIAGGVAWLLFLGLLGWWLISVDTPTPPAANDVTATEKTVGSGLMFAIVGAILVAIFATRIILKKSSGGFFSSLRHPLQVVDVKLMKNQPAYDPQTGKKLGMRTIGGWTVVFRLVMIGLLVATFFFGSELLEAYRGIDWGQNTALGRFLDGYKPGLAALLFAILGLYLLQVMTATLLKLPETIEFVTTVIFLVVSGVMIVIFLATSSQEETKQAAVPTATVQTAVPPAPRSVTPTEQPTASNQAPGKITEVILPGAYSEKYVTGVGKGFTYTLTDPAGQTVNDSLVYILDNLGNWVTKEEFYESGQTSIGKIMFKNNTGKILVLEYERTKLGH